MIFKTLLEPTYNLHVNQLQSLYSVQIKTHSITIQITLSLIKTLLKSQVHRIQVDKKITQLCPTVQ